MKPTLFWSSAFVLALVAASPGCKEAPKADIAPGAAVSVQAGTNVQVVFGTEKLKRYQFPTHINDLIIDRALSSYSEVFMVVIEPNKAPLYHKHDDTEQVFYIVEGTGVLTIGEPRRQFPVKPGDVVRIPVSTLHSIKADAEKTLKYLCVDCFGEKPRAEPTWDDHVKAVCLTNGWDYNSVVSSQH